MTQINMGFFSRLRFLNAFLRPEVKNKWSVNSIDVSFSSGWGSTPWEALQDAEKQYNEYYEKNNK